MKKFLKKLFKWAFIVIFVIGCIDALSKIASEDESTDIQSNTSTSSISEVVEQSKENQTEESQTSESTEPVQTVTFKDIYLAYEENELRADDTYKNNRYVITARVNGMSTGGLFNLTGGATLTMETRVDNTIVFFYAEFEKEQEEALKTINVGDEITFEGECLSAGTWVDCELIQ